MTLNKRKKNSRQRGSWTHGWGAKKKHRGAGHRGGRGAAGSGKRGDAKKPSIWKNTRYAGKYGFVKKNATIHSAITIHHLESHKASLEAQGIIVRIKEGFSVDLTSAGYTKLLGTGTTQSVWQITVPYATKRAVEKIVSKGGVVNLPKEE